MAEVLIEEPKFETSPLPSPPRAADFGLPDKVRNFAGKVAVATAGWLLMHGIMAPTATAGVEKPVVSEGTAVSVRYEKPGVGNAVLIECGDPSYSAPVYKQVRTMNCLTNHVREVPIPVDPALHESAKNKTKDVIACDFVLVDDHFSCGKRPQQYFPDEYLWIGENLAWGIGDKGDAQSIFRAWMASPDHRKNIINTGWDKFGVALKRSGGVNFWTTHFGDYSEQK